MTSPAPQQHDLLDIKSDPTSDSINGRPLSSVLPTHDFKFRHLGPTSDDDIAVMLKVCGVSSLEELTTSAIPATIADVEPLNLPVLAHENDALDALRSIAETNEVLTSLIGLGYYNTHTPSVIARNILENPAWYTAYTPYQPEISQGRLEALLNFQTVISDLCGLPISNASLLDEATAAAEAVTLARRMARSKSQRFFVDADCHPQVIEVIRTRMAPLDIELQIGRPEDDLIASDVFGILLAYPSSSGGIKNYHDIAEDIHAAEGIVCVTTDLLALTLLTPPGEWGADVAVGSAQRFGVPLGFGGPHAGFMAVHENAKRAIPGRLVGVSIDTEGAPALRLALQTREQHIRREKATSNICTAQVLLAVMASSYAVYHGPDGLTEIAARVHATAAVAKAHLDGANIEMRHNHLFDTVTCAVPSESDRIIGRARDNGLNLRRVSSDEVAFSVDETTTAEVISTLLSAFDVEAPPQEVGPQIERLTHAVLNGDSNGLLPSDLRRTSDFLTHETFHQHRTETAMMRYLRRLADRDLALDRTMIPLGSCTMKLNAATEMIPITWPEFSNIHPFVPVNQSLGYQTMVQQLEEWLVQITGYDAVSLQPNAGSQGEFAGLLAIRSYHDERGDQHRTVCLIPASAHGTNAASAVMAGMRVVVVKTDDNGNIDMDDLHKKAQEHSTELAAIMVTYPSTHGVYEASITDVCTLIHEHGGQVYVDGANLNALVGLARPGKFGADVSHLNLHKTFCIPHGGGGPGVGPVAVKEHLAPYLPNHPLSSIAGPKSGPGPISAAPFGSASILPITWMYIAMMGPRLLEATERAILSANYIARRLDEHYPVLYTGESGWVAHECILDVRPIEAACGVTAEDIAKRLIDYGFHAPTMSFPVAGTLMVEPTESENLAELDRFCDAMIQIRQEIADIEAGKWPLDSSPLRLAPHTAAQVGADEWTRPYPRSLGGWPTGVDPTSKYWPPVSRIDNGFGDRNLVCTCPPLDAYEDDV